MLATQECTQQLVGSYLGENALFVQGIKVDAVAQVFQTQQTQLENLAQEVCSDCSAGSVQVLGGRAKSYGQRPHEGVVHCGCKCGISCQSTQQTSFL